MAQAIMAGGCFWCTEAVFRDVVGVSEVESGYIGGTGANPTYKQVCSGTTGHAEAIRVTFDPALLSLDDLLDIHFATHDATTLNRQGNDVGTQYRSTIHFHDAEQERIAHEVIAEVAAQSDDPVVTEVLPAPVYWRAEDYHQEYFAHNPQAGYCAFVVAPKVAKFRKTFAALNKSAG